VRRRTDPELAAAEGFAERPDVTALLGRLVRDPRLQAQATARPEAFLRRQGIELPDGLAVRFGPQLQPQRGKPGPDWQPFSIRLTRCRTFWVGKPPRKETICFGIEIVPNRLPPIA
jgi:hypothetical protein